jgi:hypothetical protein
MNRCGRERMTKCTNVALSDEPGAQCRECTYGPPFGDTGPCPVCPEAIRNLLAVAHNLTTGGGDTTIDDLKRAVSLCRPLADAHFADPIHSHGTVPRPFG